MVVSSIFSISYFSLNPCSSLASHLSPNLNIPPCNSLFPYLFVCFLLSIIPYYPYFSSQPCPFLFSIILYILLIKHKSKVSMQEPDMNENMRDLTFVSGLPDLVNVFLTQSFFCEFWNFYFPSKIPLYAGVSFIVHSPVDRHQYPSYYHLHYFNYVYIYIQQDGGL